MKIWTVSSFQFPLGKQKKQKQKKPKNKLDIFVHVTGRNMQLTPKACARKLIFGDKGANVDKIPAAILSHSESNTLPKFSTIIIMFSAAAADVSQMFHYTYHPTPEKKSKLPVVSQLCKQSITGNGKWITTRYLCPHASGTRRRRLIHPLMWLKQSKWCNRTRKEEEKKKTEERLLSQSRVKYCCLTGKGSRGESVFYCHGRQVPIWRKISPRSSLYTSALVKPKSLCKVGDRMQAVMCNQKTQKYKCICLGRLIPRQLLIFTIIVIKKNNLICKT